jgi:hypothetical protein
VFSKEEAKILRIEFWTAFGVYMRKHTSQLDQRQKWVNYKTGVKDIFFRMDAYGKGATFSIELHAVDAGIRALFFAQFEEFQQYLHASTEAEWTWEAEFVQDDGKAISRIYRNLTDVSLYNKSDWGVIFAFFEACIVPLDSVWADCSEIFKDLAN